MFEVKDLYDLTLPGAFASAEEWVQFSSSASPEDLYSLLQDGAFSSVEEFQQQVNFGASPVKKKEDTVSVLEDGSSGLQEPSVQVEEEQIDFDPTPGITALEEAGLQLPTPPPRDFTQPFLGPVGMDDPMSVEEQQELLNRYIGVEPEKPKPTMVEEESVIQSPFGSRMGGGKLKLPSKEVTQKYEQEKSKRDLTRDKDRKIGYVLNNLDENEGVALFQNLASTRGEISDEELQQMVDVVDKKIIDNYGQEEYDLVQKIGGDVTPEDLFYGGNISTSPSIIDNLIVEGDETTTVTNLNNQFDGTPFTFSEAIWGSDALEVNVTDGDGNVINSKIVRIDDGAKASQQLRDFMTKTNLSKGNKEFLNEGKINGKDIKKLSGEEQSLARYKYMLENKDKFSAGKGTGFSMDANAIMRFVEDNPNFFPPEELQSIKLQLDEALADQYKEDAQLEGSFFGSLGESFVKGLMQTPKFATNLAIDIGGALMPSMFMPANPYSAINFDKNGNRLSDSDIIDRVKKRAKRDMISAMDNAVESSFTGTTQAWMNSEERNDYAKALNFLFESLGVVASTGGRFLKVRPGMTAKQIAAIQKTAKTRNALAFFAYAANGIEDEMAGTEYDELSEWKKKLISFPYGVMIGALENLGWEASTGAFGNKVFDKISRNIISKALKSVPKDASEEVIKTAIENSTRAAIANGTIKIISGALSEGFVEGTQEFGDVGLKNIVNGMMEKDYFANAPDLTTLKGVRETYDQAKESGYYGFMAGSGAAGGGGLIQSGKKALRRDADIREYNERKEAHTNETQRNKLIYNITNAQKQGQLTAEQAEAAKEKVLEDAATFEQIPNEGLSNKNKLESFDLITERNNLEKEIAGKNEELVTKQRDRIRDINAQLTIIGTQDATTEQEASDLDEDQQAPDVQEMEEGTPQPKPEQTTAEEVEVKEELKPTEEQREKLEKQAVRELKKENRKTRREGFKGDKIKGTRKKYEPTQEEIDARVDELFQAQQQEDQEVLDLEAAIEGEVKEGRALPSETTAVEEITGAVPEDVAVEEEVTTEEAPVDETVVEEEVTTEEAPVAETVVEEEVTTEEAPLVNPKVVISGTGDGYQTLSSSNTTEAESESIKDARGDKTFEEDGFRITKRKDGSSEVSYRSKVKVKDRASRPGYAMATVIIPEGSPVNKQQIQEAFDNKLSEIIEGNRAKKLGSKLSDLTAKQNQQLADAVVEAVSTKTTSDATQMITPVPTKTETKKAPTKTKVDGVVMSDKKRSKKEQALVDRAKRAAKALRKFGKGGVTIELHDDTESFKKVTGQDGRGAYDKTSNTIHINLSTADNTTIAHEAFHAVLLQRVKDSNTAKVTKAMFDAVRKARKGDTRTIRFDRIKVVDGKTETEKVNLTVEEFLEDFANNYEENVQDEEKLAELTGLLASSYVNLAPAPKSKVRQWVDKVMTPIAKRLGIKVEEFTKTDQGVVDLLNAISAKVTIGEEIQEGDVKVLEEIETKPETKKGKSKKISWTKSEGKRPKRKTTGTEMGKVVRSYEAGEITLEEYNKKSDELMPTRMKEKFTEPATNPELGKLRGQKKAKINAPIKEGADVGLRLDIPLMEDTGVAAVTIHPGRGLTSSASSYRGAAVISDVEFKSNPKSSLGLASEATTKNPTIARMAGSFVNIGETIEEQNEAAKKLAQQAIDEGWTQVGINPSKHSYFYDRSNGKPLKSADRVVQVGDLIYAENAKTTTIYDDRFIVKGKTDKKGGPLRFQKEGVSVSEDSQTEPFKGGKFVESPADGLMRRQVGGFEVTYVEQDRMADLMKEGLVTQPKDLSDFADNYVAITAPDDMLAGQISYKGKPIFDGGGGVFFTTKYGDVWASGNRQTAETLTKIINESVKRNNGKGYLVLAKGTDSKLVSSVSGVESSLSILDIMLEEGMVSPSDFRRAVSEAVRKNGGSISLRKSAKELKKDVTDYFNDPKTSTFDKRGNVVKDLIGNLAKSKSLKENKAEIIDLLGGDKSKGLGAGVTPKSQSLVDLVAKVAAEQVTKGLKVGDIYAVIEVDGEVEVKEDSHPSYPFHVVSKTKSKPILHLPQDRQAGKNILTSSSGKPYSVDVVSVKSGTFNDASTMTSELSKTAMREQKSLMQIGTYYAANNQGFFPKQVNSYQLKRDLEQIGFGLKRAKSGDYYATRNGRKVNPFPPEPSRYRFQGEKKIGIVEEKSFTSKNTVADIIIAARREGFKDKAIRFYILNRRSDIKEENGKPLRAKTVDDMLRVPANILENVPDSFKEIEGGAAAGLRLYQKVEQLRDRLLAANARIKSPKLSDAGIKQKIKEKREELKKKKLSDEQLAKELDAFTKREYKNNKARKEMKTESEIMDEVIEFLEKQPEYIEAGDKGKKTPSLLQSKMQAELQATIGFRPSREVAQNLSKLKNRARAMDKAGRDLQEIKRQLRATLRKSLPKTEYSKPEVMRLISKVSEVDAKNLQRIVQEVETFIVKKNVQILEGQIDKLLGTKVAKSEAGRRKGKFGYDEAARLEAINNNIVKNKKVDRKVVKYTAEEIMEKNETLRKEFNELMRNPEGLSTENINKLTDLQIAININSANLMKAELAKKEDISPNIIAPLVSAQESLQELIEEGRSKFKAELQEAHEEYQRQFAVLWEEMTGQKLDMSDPEVQKTINEKIKEKESKESIDAKKNKFRKLATKTMDSIVLAFDRTSALFQLMDKISIMPGDLAGGRIQEEITDRVNESSRIYKGRMLVIEKSVELKMEEVFGKKWRKKTTELNKKTIPFKTTERNETISQNQLAYLYNQYKDPANAGSFETMFGQEKILKTDSKEEQERKKKINKDFTKQKMDELISQLDPQLKEWADWQVDEFFPSVYEYYNDTYRKIYRTDMPWNQFYAGRIYRDGIVDEPLDLLANASILRTSVGAASTLERKQNTKPITAMNINNTLTSYIQDMEYFAAYAETIRDIDKMFTNENTTKFLKSRYGNDINDLIKNSIQKIAGKGQQKFKYARFINWSTNAFIFSRLAINPVVFIKQLTSIPTYANDIGFANWIKYSKIGTTVSERRTRIKQDYDEIIENSVYLADRAKGLSLRDAISTYTRDDSNFLEKETLQGFKRLAMGLTKSGDKAAIMLGGLPNYRYYKAQYKKQNPKATDQQVIDYAIRKFERDTKNTQQSSDIQDRDYYQTDDGLMRAFNMFMTTPKQYLRKEIVAFRNLGRKIKARDSKAGKGTVGQNLRQLAMYHVMMPALFQWAALGFPVDMDDEDKDDMLRSVILGNLNALFVVGDIFTMFADYFTDKPWAGNADTLPILSQSARLIKALEKWDKKANAAKPDPEKVEEAQAEFFQTLAEGFGLPAKQIDKLLDNYTKLFTEDMSNAEKVRRILNYSNYVIEGKKDDKKKKKDSDGKRTKAEQKKFESELKKYNPDAYRSMGYEERDRLEEEMKMSEDPSFEVEKKRQKEELDRLNREIYQSYN